MPEDLGQFNSRNGQRLDDVVQYQARTDGRKLIMIPDQNNRSRGRYSFKKRMEYLPSILHRSQADRIPKDTARFSEIHPNEDLPQEVCEWSTPGVLWFRP